MPGGTVCVRTAQFFTLANMKLASIPNVEIFAAGTFHKGTPEQVEFTSADLDAIVRNFRALSSGTRPTYEPFVKIGKVDPHRGDNLTFEDGEPAAAWITNVRKRGKVLLADFADVQPDVARWIELKLYKKVSAEIDKPPDGEAHPHLGVKGPVLKAVALLGANPPAVKGLADIPRPKFSAIKSRITHYVFAEARIMDRQSMLDYLSSMGVDVSQITDAVPDAVLASLVKACQQAQAQAKSGATGQAEGEPPPVVPPAAGTGNHLLPTSIAVKFSEMEERVNGLAATLQGITDKVTATATLADKQADGARQATVHAFCEQAAKEGLLTPAEVERDPKTGEPLPHTVLARLLRADHVRHHVFSENGKQTTKTELELQMDEIKKRNPLDFSEKVKVVGGGGNSVMDRIQRIRDQAAADYKARHSGAEIPLHKRLNMLPPAALR